MFFSYILKSDPIGDEKRELVEKFNHRHDPHSGRFSSRSYTDASGSLVRHTTIDGEKVTHNAKHTIMSGQHTLDLNRVHGVDVRSHSHAAVRVGNRHRSVNDKNRNADAHTIAGTDLNQMETSASTVNVRGARKEVDVTSHKQDIKRSISGVSAVRAQQKKVHEALAMKAAFDSVAGKGHGSVYFKSATATGNPVTGANAKSKAINQKSGQITIAAGHYANRKAGETAVGKYSITVGRGASAKQINLSDLAMVHGDGSIEIPIPVKGTSHGAALNHLIKTFKRGEKVGATHSHGDRVLVSANKAVEHARSLLAGQGTKLAAFEEALARHTVAPRRARGQAAAA